MLWTTIAWYGIIPAIGVLIFLPAAIIALATASEVVQVRDSWLFILASLPGIACVLWLTPPSRQYFGLYPNIFGPYSGADASPMNSSHEHLELKAHPAPGHPAGERGRYADTRPDVPAQSDR
jgi:hypothetical protein